MPNILPTSFYQRNAIQVAYDLIGKILVHRYRNHLLAARIVETEAYVGQNDLACHASKGLTPRTATMFRTGGCAYVYFIYGMYDMFNIVCSKAHDPQAVLLRAAEPLNWTADLSGPGKLTRALHITTALDQHPLSSPDLFLQAPPTNCPIPHIVATPRVGVAYAQHWASAELRFYDAHSSDVSKPHPKHAPAVILA